VEEAYAATDGVGRRHRPHGAVVEEMGASLPGGLEEMGTVPVWKRWQVIRAAWVADLKQAVRMEHGKRR
jgi:hypothetical protein